MALGNLGYVSIAELVVYIPALVLAIIVCRRHGLHRASGWMYTVILCVVRIAGSICQLITYTDQSEGLLKATFTIDSIGISPLLLATLGMLSRLVDWINSKGTTIFSIKQFRIVQLLISIGLILSIAGGSSASTSADGTVTTSSTSKVAIVLYIVAFAGLSYILVTTAGYRTAVPLQERRIPVALAIAWPFILVRLLYSTLAVFVQNDIFSLVGGSIAVRVGMAIVEEFIVVIDYLVLGYSLQKLEPEQQGELASRQWKDRRRNRSRRQSEGP
ncbi:hypothetical protein TOPH_06253 [Tolypocladium ophioglossoides CBS 100239]|uniref:DUF7702 domain-containing protein n=1 Tax=Tolypocladium ophioglossoides (strain CBS 100239) TaxID=1163406 RepID=A0A0L0N4P2_TOLOC|nr:hypothetical protein TOPH_06253 [Tolypocladium ophioglossoides CBS 100239]